MLDSRRGSLAAACALAGAGAAAWNFAAAAEAGGGLSHGFLLALPGAAASVGIGAGLAMLSLGLRRRVGAQVVCAGCGYVRAEASRLLDRCPECGRAWRWFGGTRRGTPVSRPWLAAVGAALTALALLVAVVRAAAPAAWVRITPTGVLLRQLADGPWSGAAEQWGDLERRTITPAEESWLIEALLDRRLRTGRLEREAHVWLFGRWFLGALSKPQEDRYFGEMVTLRLDAPSSVTAGERLPFGVYAEFRGDRLGLHGEEEVWIVRDYARLDALPETVSAAAAVRVGAPPPDASAGDVSFRFPRPVAAHEFADRMRAGGDGRGGPGSGSVPAPAEAGRARLTVVLHVFIARTGVMPAECRWINETDLHIPVGTTRHLRVELLHDVEVFPAQQGRSP